LLRSCGGRNGHLACAGAGDLTGGL